jgi:flagellar basal body-associated protein FliL
MSEKAKKKKKAQASSQPTVLWTVRLEQKLTAVWGEFKEIARGLRSPNRTTRRMSMLFFASLVGVLLVCKLSWNRYRELAEIRAQHAQQEASTENQLSTFIGKQAEEAKHKYTSYEIGTFTIELKQAPGQKKIPGVLNMAEVDLVAECDVKETCTYLEDYSTQVKSQVTNVFVAMDREQLMSKEGKRKIKKQLIDRLNSWLPKGRVENVFISRLIIS